MTTPTPPCLGEREAVARTGERQAILWLVRVGRLTRSDSATMTDAIIAEHIAPLRTENETLRAEREQSEKHRNDLMDSIVSLKTERGALKSRLADVEAERDAAISRVEEARSAVAWTNEVTPEINDWGQATVCLAPEEFERMRALTTPEPPHGD